MAWYCKNSLYCSMKKQFSKSWKRSKQPRKQRKYIANAPLHIRHKLLSAHLSKELQKKHNRRNFPVRKGDKVKIITGQFKKKTGAITKVDLKKLKVHIDNAFVTKRDGTKAFYPIRPSNLLITELKLDDKERKKSLEKKK